MSQLIDSVGTFLGTIVDESVSLSTGGYPQWVARIHADQKYIDSPSDMEHFQLEAPGYVDWAGFDEEITAFMVLFKSQDTFNADTALLNYEQLQKATGWNGAAFESLNGENKGKQILFRVQSREYQGKTRIGVEWIDSKDASPERQLRKLDEASIKALSAKLTIKPKVTATAAKPAKPSPQRADSAPAQASGSRTSAAPAAGPSNPTTPVAGTTPPAKRGRPPAPKPTPTPAPSGVPSKETTKLDAWEYVVSHKGDLTDDEVADAWMSATGEVGENKAEEEFTPVEWSKVRDIVVRDLALSK